MTAEVASLAACRVYDTVPARQQAFVEEMDGRFGGVRVEGTASAEAAIRGADIVVPGGPITAERRASIVSEWIAPGALVVAIDYDSYVTDECIAAMDLVITDDRGQIEDAREREGKFLGVTRIDADNAEMIAAGKGRRDERPAAHSRLQPRDCARGRGDRGGGAPSGEGEGDRDPAPGLRRGRPSHARTIRPRTEGSVGPCFDGSSPSSLFF